MSDLEKRVADLEKRVAMVEKGPATPANEGVDKDSKSWQTARLARLKGLIKDEPRAEGRLARKWSAIEQEIAELEAKLGKGDDPKT